MEEYLQEKIREQSLRELNVLAKRKCECVCACMCIYTLKNIIRGVIA